MRSTREILRCAAVAVAVSVGCGGDDPLSDLALPRGGACGDAHFWAATATDDVAVTVTIEARDRSPRETTTTTFVLPDPAVEVRILEGEGLSRNFCNDVVAQEAMPTGRQAATAGEGTIVLEPAPEGADHLSCGSVDGELELTGLVADDGTTFAPVTVTSDSLGCYAG